MFIMIGIGERVGNGVPDIYKVWDDEGYEAPEVKEEFGNDRTLLVLSFRKKQATKTDGKKPSIKTVDKKPSIKTVELQDMIRKYLKSNEGAKTAEIAEHINKSVSWTKDLLHMMDDIEALGSNRNRTYRLKDE